MKAKRTRISHKSHIIPRGKNISELKYKEESKNFTTKQRLDIQRRITHYENTKDLPII